MTTNSPVTIKLQSRTITKEEIIKQLNESVLSLDIAYLDSNFDVGWDVVSETEEFLPVTENGGASTIELKIDDKIIWSNSFDDY